MNLRMMDLNLLLVFDAVIKERSVTRAAARLNTTQPAISQALSRLRSLLGDDLFVRTPNGMEPTPYSRAIAEPVRQALSDLQSALRVAAPFDPATSRRTFTIALDNRSALLLGAPLAVALAAQAPGVTLNLVPSGTLDVPGALDDNGLDLALGGLRAPAERFSDAPLFDDPFVMLLRQDHPAGCLDRITLEALAAYPFLELSSTQEETAFVDTAFAQVGLTRRIGLRAPLLSAAPALLRSDMIAVLSERGARAFAAFVPLQVLPLPFETPRSPTRLLWHRRYDQVAAHRWLRQAILHFAEPDCAW